MRFNLRLLFVVATLLIVFFGYSQLRRKRILDTAEQLKAEGYFFAVPNSWIDRIWQRKFNVAGTVEYVNGKEHLETLKVRRASGRRIGLETERIQGSEMERLERLGVLKYE